MHNPFTMGDVDALCALCTDAGLGAVSIDTLAGHVRFRSIDHWIQSQLHGTPMAALLNEAQCEAMIAAAPRAFSEFLTAEGELVAAMEAHVITAMRP